MENQYWNFHCPSCKENLKIKSRPNDIGKEKKLTCFHCYNDIKIVVGKPDAHEAEQKELEDFNDKKLPEHVVEKIDKISKITASNSEIREIIFSLIKDGVILNIGFSLLINKDILVNEIEPKVDENGTITPGTFSEEDYKIFKEMKIDIK